MLFTAYKAHFNPRGASALSLKKLQESVVGLPLQYIDFLSQHNGGEAPLMVQPLTLCLDTAEFALSCWQSNTYSKDLPCFFVFASNGAGTLIAFDLSSKHQPPVVSFDPIDPTGSNEIVALNLIDLLNQIGEL
jgi:SMI1 / KNR4 family (SUKH-1)